MSEAVRYTRDATFPDGSPRLLAGMHRPPLENFTKGGGYIMCSCGQVLQTVDATQNHWSMGHFDYPLYQEGEDVERS